VNITAGDLVMALRNGADAPYELNLRIAHRALTRDGVTVLGYDEWLDSMTPTEMVSVREQVEDALGGDDGDETDPTLPSSL
jgi:hypothetical protein